MRQKDKKGVEEKDSHYIGKLNFREQPLRHQHAVLPAKTAT
jgi:predicted HicB family RNase H-like nuclease